MLEATWKPKHIQKTKNIKEEFFFSIDWTDISKWCLISNLLVLYFPAEIIKMMINTQQQEQEQQNKVIS